ncbi:MAG: GGDEF domain-containing protein [Acidobacteria bacterium]|nr:MAG: GGDEF domain-containing protein [Acidobacteriota bacterium]REK02152.1 MAG: GGDEF domain-containing protein [Acidobacteriota bacterium]REK14046.1 MAG: GGDEF domain-containing protein [Acidobacteriota bacterium]REK42041.1 MAG: GGDEF domain-containing protein [Acidobacteriota bacterium]
MSRKDPRNSEEKKNGPDSGLLTAGAASLFLLAGAIGLVLVPVGNVTRVLGIAVLFAVQYTVIVLLTRSRNEEDKSAGDEIFTPEIDEKLLSLEDAGKLLGGSLRLKDMYRLVVARTSEIVPLQDPVLLVFDDSGAIVQRVTGQSGTDLSPGQEKIATKAAKDGRVFLDQADEAFGYFAGLTLTEKGKAFASLCGRISGELSYPDRTKLLLEAVAQRIAPVLAASLSFDKKAADALVDHLTWLPNAKAFDLVLENRIAEAKRFKEASPLIVMAVDLKDFNEINSRFGHHTGDRALAFAAEVIRDQLRKMDLVARTSADEFLAVLPGAKQNTAGTIIERIAGEFARKSLTLDDGEKLTIGINFGSAAFGPGRDTPEDLVKAARLDRDGQKPPRSNQVLRFPTKHSN